MYITRWKSTANLKLIVNLVVSPYTSKMTSCAEWLDCRIWKVMDWSSDWSSAVSYGMLGVECRHTYFNSYLQILWPPLKLLGHHTFSYLGNPDIPLRNPVWATLFQCKLASCWLLTKYHEILLRVNTMSIGGLSQNNLDGYRTDGAQANCTDLGTPDCKNVIKMSILQSDILQALEFVGRSDGYQLFQLKVLAPYTLLRFHPEEKINTFILNICKFQTNT